MAAIMIPAAFMAATMRKLETMDDARVLALKAQLARAASFGTLDRDNSYVLRAVNATIRERGLTR